MIKFEYNGVTGISTCTIKINNSTYVGTAICHEDDKEFMSEKTGCHIAELRATIKMYQDQKRTLRDQLKILKHLKETTTTSRKANVNGYEACRLREEIKRLEEDIATFSYLIKCARIDLREFIGIKEELYQSLRKLRAKQKNVPN